MKMSNEPSSNLMLELGIAHAQLQRVLEGLLDAHPGVVSLLSRVKSLDSIREKISRKNISSIRDIQDLIGFRIVVRNSNDIPAILDVLRSEFSLDSTATHDLNNVHRVHAVIRLSDKRKALPEWKAFGETSAEIQILSVSSDAWQRIYHILQYKNEKPGEAIAKFATHGLEDTIAEFERLLEKPDVHEKRDIHPFIETSNFLLHPNPAEIFSEVPIGLGTEFRIDFLIREADGTYVLVEIENPRHRLFTQKGDFTAEVNHAQRQVEDWQEWIEDNLSTVQKAYPDMSSPRGLVVIGRLGTMAEKDRKRLDRRNINLRGRLTIWTYDHLLSSAKASIKSIRNNIS